jgi:hypothetical protein
VQREPFSRGRGVRESPQVLIISGTPTGIHGESDSTGGKGWGEHPDHGGVSGPGEGTRSPGQVSL